LLFSTLKQQSFNSSVATFVILKLSKLFKLLNPGTSMVVVLAILVLVIIWSVIWKGIALWKSARNSQKVWYVFLLIVNTAGILEIIYLLLFQKKR